MIKVIFVRLKLHKNNKIFLPIEVTLFGMVIVIYKIELKF